MKPISETKYKILVVVNGSPLTFKECSILDESDPTFLKFSDTFGNVLRYNKNLIASLEVLK